MPDPEKVTSRFFPARSNMVTLSSSDRLRISAICSSFARSGGLRRPFSTSLRNGAEKESFSAILRSVISFSSRFLWRNSPKVMSLAFIPRYPFVYRNATETTGFR
jgi:hypothetical protein